jgi:hypothetical protein
VRRERIECEVTIKASVSKDGTLTLTVGDQKAVPAKARCDVLQGQAAETIADIAVVVLSM